MVSRKEVNQAVCEYAKIKNQISALEAESQKLHDLIMDYMDEAGEDAIVTKDIIAYRSIWEQTRIDTEKLKTKYPIIAEDCQYIKRLGILRTKRNKG